MLQYLFKDHLCIRYDKKRFLITNLELWLVWSTHICYLISRNITYHIHRFSTHKYEAFGAGTTMTVDIKSVFDLVFGLDSQSVHVSADNLSMISERSGYFGLYEVNNRWIMLLFSLWQSQTLVDFFWHWPLPPLMYSSIQTGIMFYLVNINGHYNPSLLSSCIWRGWYLVCKQLLYEKWRYLRREAAFTTTRNPGMRISLSWHFGYWFKQWNRSTYIFLCEYMYKLLWSIQFEQGRNEITILQSGHSFIYI